MESGSDLVLIDTSVWIEYINRPQSRHTAVIRKLLDQDRVVCAGVILAELIQGIKNPKEVIMVKDTFEILPFIEGTREDWIAAGAYLRELRSRGKTASVMDGIIALLCLRHNLSLFTLDHHFDYFKELKRFRLA